METITAIDIDKKIAEAPGPVLIEFWAPWAPCRASSPAVEEANLKYKDLTVFRVDASKEKALVKRYNVKVVPTYVFITPPAAKGEVATESTRIMGAKGRSTTLRAVRHELGIQETTTIAAERVDDAKDDLAYP